MRKAPLLERSIPVCRALTRYLLHRLSFAICFLRSSCRARNTIHDVANAASERVAYLDENGGVHVFALGKLCKGRCGYTGGKTHLRTRHSPVDKQLPKPIVAECHITKLFNVDFGANYTISPSIMANKRFEITNPQKDGGRLGPALPSKLRHPAFIG